MYVCVCFERIDCCVILQYDDMMMCAIMNDVSHDDRIEQSRTDRIEYPGSNLTILYSS